MICIIGIDAATAPNKVGLARGIMVTVYLFSGCQLVACLHAFETCAQLNKSSMRKLK